MLTHFNAIESVKSAQRGNKIGKKIDPGRSRLGKKIGRLEVYTPLGWGFDNFIVVFLELGNNKLTELNVHLFLLNLNHLLKEKPSPSSPASICSPPVWSRSPPSSAWHLSSTLVLLMTKLCVSRDISVD